MLGITAYATLCHMPQQAPKRVRCTGNKLWEQQAGASRALWDSASPPPPRRLLPARRAPARVLQASHQALPAEAVRARLRPLDHHWLAQHLKAHSAGEAVRDVALHVHLGALGRHLRAGQAEREAVATRGGKLVLGGREGGGEERCSGMGMEGARRKGGPAHLPRHGADRVASSSSPSPPPSARRRLGARGCPEPEAPPGGGGDAMLEARVLGLAVAGA